MSDDYSSSKAPKFDANKAYAELKRGEQQRQMVQTCLTNSKMPKVASK